MDSDPNPHCRHIGSGTLLVAPSYQFVNVAFLFSWHPPCQCSEQEPRTRAFCPFHMAKVLPNRVPGMSENNNAPDLVGSVKKTWNKKFRETVSQVSVSGLSRFATQAVLMTLGGFDTLVIRPFMCSCRPTIHSLVWLSFQNLQIESLFTIKNGRWTLAVEKKFGIDSHRPSYTILPLPGNYPVVAWFHFFLFTLQTRDYNHYIHYIH